MKKTNFLGLISLLSLYSCANMFNSMVLPNQCKKCELINKQTGKILFTNQGCGGENTRLEEEVKIEAFDQSRFGNLCDLEIKCTTWRKDPESTN